MKFRLSCLRQRFLLLTFVISLASICCADDLAHRKGTLIVKTNPGEMVTVVQKSHEFWFGAAIANGIFEDEYSDEDEIAYKRAFLQNFNSAVTENALKWMVMQPTPDPPNYEVVDAILDWTDAKGIPLRGHNIYWGVHQFVQEWVKDLNKRELLTALEERARDIGSRYKGRFAQYDLNNEMIHRNYYAEQLGDEIIRDMANWVMEEDPDAKLYLNDYDILTGNRLEEFIRHIKDLLKMGVPLAGIGVQGHLHTDTFDPAQLTHALDELAKFDLPIVITEFNMPGQRSKYHKERGRHVAGSKEKEQFAKELDAYYRICFAHPAVDGILMWGFWEKANWIPESSLFDVDWNPTPLHAAYRNLVFDEWWTRTRVEADSRGVARIETYYGDYAVKVGKVEKQVSLSSKKGRRTVKFGR